MADDGGASTPAPATNETPPARWRLAGGVIAGGLAVSVIVHLALVGTVLVMGSWGKPPEPLKAMPVDVVTPEELAEITEKAKTDPAPQPSIADTPAQQQTPQSPSPQPQQQAQSASPPPSPPPPSPPKLDAFTPPFPSSAAPPADAPPPPPTESTGQAAQLAQMLGLPTPVAGLSGGSPSEFKANLSAEQIAGFSSHLQSCWTPAPELAKAANLTIFLRVRLQRDGSLAATPEVLGGSASMQALTLRDLAVQTLTKCPAYTALPADKYDEWRVLDLHFTPNGVSTAAPAPSSERKPKRAG